jgi:hypothetical protein
MAVGFVWTVLGIREIGGLLNLCVGLILIFVGSIPLILAPGRVRFHHEDIDQELRRFFDNET